MEEEMNQSTGMVAEFHKTFNHPINNKIGEEEFEISKLRIRLLFEELSELAIATGCYPTFLRECGEHIKPPMDDIVQDGVYDELELEEVIDEFNILWRRLERDQMNETTQEDVDLVEELDALCDLQVVLDGKILTSGHHLHFDKAFSEVHKSNMSKACSTEEKASIAAYEYSNKGILTYKELYNGKYIIKRSMDNKVLKGPDFKEPDLKAIVDNTLKQQSDGQEED